MPTKIKRAFTLAEILITLTIIGVVAAITIAPIINKYQKKQLEVKLRNFITIMNQAAQMSKNELGDYLETQQGYNQSKRAFETYFKPYLKVVNYNRCSSTSNSVCVYLANGDLFTFTVWADGTDIKYCPKGKIKYSTRDTFIFQYGIPDKNNNYIQPYVKRWNGELEDLKKGEFGCHKDSTHYAYCTKLIEMNGWKIGDDYPW